MWDSDDNRFKTYGLGFRVSVGFALSGLLELEFLMGLGQVVLGVGKFWRISGIKVLVRGLAVCRVRGRPVNQSLGLGFRV